jgi:hypothetical protein
MKSRSLKSAFTAVALIAFSAVASAVSLASAPSVGRTAVPTADLAAVTGTALGANRSVSAVATGEPSLAMSAAAVEASTASPAIPALSASDAVSVTAGTSSPTSTSSSIGLWAADWGGAASSRSFAGWEAAAQNDSILIGDARTYAPWISKLHGWNSKVMVLVYNLGPYLQKGSADFTTIQQPDPSWFAHDARGNLINLHMFPDNYLMDMGNAGYRAWHAQQLEATVVEYGFDGAMDDSMGTAALSTGYASGVPIDTATGQAYTDTEYLNNSVLMLNADKAALGGKYLAFNGLISGTMYQSETDILASSNANAGISELFLRQPMAPINSFPATSALDAALQMMSSMSAHGKALLGWTKIWCSSSSSQVAKWEDYGLAAYLLGKQSTSYWDFMPSKDADNTAVSYSNLKDQLGAPVGAYTTQGSTLSRKFQHGSVSLNTSTDTGSITVT